MINSIVWKPRKPASFKRLFVAIFNEFRYFIPLAVELGALRMATTENIKTASEHFDSLQPRYQRLFV